MIPNCVALETKEDKIRFAFGDLSTGWMDKGSSFCIRIDEQNLNEDCLSEHISKEFEIRNVLDDAIILSDSKKFAGAIELFDEVLFYDPQYGEALLGKSHALFAQKHFVKALRYYSRAVKSEPGLKDIDYHKLLLANANAERDNFPKLKRNIYAGDEHFSKGEYEKALKNYEKALADTSRLKEKIIFRLLNKKATTHLKLNDFESALSCFNESLNQVNNDYAWFGKGWCEYRLGLEGAGESLKKAVNISKEQLLKKGRMLNGLGLHEDALKTFEFILENHFMADGMYAAAWDGKRLAESKLNV